MPAFVTAQVKLKDPEKMQAYAEKAMAIMQKHGCEPLFRAPKVKQLTGQSDHDLLGVFRFPNVGAVHSWFDSAEYAELHSLRYEAADVTFTVYESD